MNPLRYSPAKQAKALAALLGGLATGLAAGGDPLIVVIGSLATFYTTFALPNR